MLSEVSSPSGKGSLWVWLISHLSGPLFWGILLTSLGLWMMLPRRGRAGRRMGIFVSAFGILSFVLHLRTPLELSSHLGIYGAGAGSFVHVRGVAPTTGQGSSRWL